MTSGETKAPPANSLRAKATRGVAILGLRTIGAHGIQILRLAVVARLLAPEDFGLFALAMALVQGLEVVTSLGPNQYLIQRKSVDAQFLGTAWVMRAVFGGAICLLALAMAPLYASTLTQPMAGSVISIVAFASLLRGFKSIGVFLAERDVRFGRLTIYELSISAVEALVVIVLAFWLRDVKALAWALVITAVVDVGLSYFLFRAPFRPSFQRAAIKEILSVGKHFFIISLGTFAMVQGDNLIIGALLGSTLLGYYVVAYRLCEVPFRLVSQVTNRVALPIFSRVQDDPRRKRRGFLMMADLQLAVLIPITVATITLADVLVPTLYGPGWERAIQVTRALGLVILGRGLVHIVAPFLVANGHFSFASKAKVMEVTACLIAVSIGTYWFDLEGAALGAGVGYLLAAAQRLYYVFVREGVSAREFTGALLAAAACSLPPAILAAACAAYVPGQSPIGVATLSLAAFGLSYAALSFLFRRTLRIRVADAIAALRARRAPA